MKILVIFKRLFFYKKVKMILNNICRHKQSHGSVCASKILRLHAITVLLHCFILIAKHPVANMHGQDKNI